MSVLLIRRRRPIGEPAPAVPAVPGESSAVVVVDGTAGAGRLSRVLLELGVDLAGVRQAVVDPEAPLDDLERADLGATFDRVVLGSHLVNAPDPDRRGAFVRLAARHLAATRRLAAAASVLVEHHPLDWAETAAPTPATPGSDVGMEDVRVDPPFVSAVSTFDVGGRWVRQPFTARVLSDAELSAALGAAGLVVERRIAPTWLQARREG